MLRKCLLLLVPCLLLVAVCFTFTPSAHAASSCISNPSDATCNYQDPATTGCGNDPGVYNLATAYIYSGPNLVGTVVLRYSPECQSAWAHTVSYVAPGYVYAQIVRDDRLVSSNSTTRGVGIKSNLLYHTGHTAHACGQIGTAAACTSNA